MTDLLPESGGELVLSENGRDMNCPISTAEETERAMAQKIQVLLVDDLDGGEAAETVKFALDGSTYEIDLSDVHAKKLRESLQPFVQHARKPKRDSSGPRSSRGASSRERSAEIRAWAKERGKKVNERGRIPASIVEEFEAAAGR